MNTPLPADAAPRFSLLRAAQHRRMPWKNGGGETIEIAVQPPAAGLDDFDWRLSIATITRNGAFSRFAGIDRRLALLEGDGLRLVIGSGDVTRTVELRPGDAPLHFEGAAPVQAQLLNDPVRDLNLMTRRGAWRQRMQAHRLQQDESLQCPSRAASQLWLCHAGRLRLSPHVDPDTTRSFELGALDVLRADTARGAEAAGPAIEWRLHAATPCTVWFIELDPAAPIAAMHGAGQRRRRLLRRPA